MEGFLNSFLNFNFFMSTLSKPDILKHIEHGNIIINPYNENNLQNASYDVRLGKYFYRQYTMSHTQTLNPFHEKSLRKMYRDVEEGIPVSKLKSEKNPFHNLDNDDLVILVAPNETILAHTVEFIGGRNGVPDKNLGAVATEMRARSSIGRIGIAVCKCAGWIDIGYINRVTMEITNFSTSIIPLVVGMRIAQIIFHETTPTKEEDTYYNGGKYQTTGDFNELKKSWKPEMMLPKLYIDSDLGHFKEYYS